MVGATGSPCAPPPARAVRPRRATAAAAASALRAQVRMEEATGADEGKADSEVRLCCWEAA